MLTATAVDPALAAMSEHQQEIAAWRAGRVERLTAEDGWLSLIGLHWLPVDATQTLGNGGDNDVDLQAGPARLGTLSWVAGKAAAIQQPGGVGADQIALDQGTGHRT